MSDHRSCLSHLSSIQPRAVLNYIELVLGKERREGGASRRKTGEAGQRTCLSVGDNHQKFSGNFMVGEKKHIVFSFTQ